MVPVNPDQPTLAFEAFASEMLAWVRSERSDFERRRNMLGELESTSRPLVALDLTERPELH